MKFVLLRNFFIKAISSVFFIGYLPLVPGSFGSLAAVGLVYLLKTTNSPTYFLFTLATVSYTHLTLPTNREV